MHQINKTLLIIFTFILYKGAYSQIIWHETFDVPDKGYWADSIGQLQSDLSDVHWTLDVNGCTFLNESDYAKTVTTADGRFEVLDCEGEVTWTSEQIPIAAYDAINISLETGETGSSTVAEKKYIKAFYSLNNNILQPFSSDSLVAGNWGNSTLVEKSISGQLLQIVIKMNSSYSIDKVFFDNLIVEAIDSSSLAPSQIRINKVPFFSFMEDTLTLQAAVFNANEELIIDSTIFLNFASTQMQNIFQNSNNGIYTWKIKANETGPLSFSIIDNEAKLPNTDSSLFVFSNNEIILNENFEGEYDEGWEINKQWEVSSDNAISGNQSVKHIAQTVDGKSELVYTGQLFNLNEEVYLFSFKLKNGDWDPSSSNYFYFWMVEQNNTSTSGGYAIGIDAKGTSDLVSVWNVKQNKPEDLLAETQYNWDEEDTVQINIVRSSTGSWIINATDLQTGESHCSYFDNTEYIKIDQLRLVFNYIVSRSGQLWFDDLLICGQNAPPHLARVVAISTNQIRIEFNEDIQTNLLDISNFSLTGKSGYEYSIRSLETVAGNAIAINTDTINEPYLTITARMFRDLDNRETPFDQIDFEFALPAEKFDIVFSEIMIDPNPPLGLPETEYIELFNRSDKFIQMGNLNLFVRNTNYPIPNKILTPHSYLILCDKKYDSIFSGYGEIDSFEKFPSLLNTGAYLNINTNDGTVIDEITYTDDWYNDTSKDNGGFSIERIDLNRFCGQSKNWTASSDEKGGSPGVINSNNSENIDNAAPVLLTYDIVNFNEIVLYFNEALDTLIAQRKNSYTIPGITITAANYLAKDFAVALHFASPFKVNTEYTIEVTRVGDECGNIGTGNQITFVQAEITRGSILINEVLFNPFTGGADFVELYNNAGVSVDFTDLKLATRDDSLKLKSVYEISNWHYSFKNKSYMVFSIDTANIKENYYVPFPENLFQMEKFPAYNNDEGRVVLLNDSLQVIDEFYYNENMQSEWLNQVDGVSLERVLLTDSTNKVLNWHSASSIVGYATPGYANSQKNIEAQTINSIELTSEVVSPNGDNFHDELEINFTLDNVDYLANVYIFNANGYEVKRLTNNDLIGNGNKITCNLRDVNGNLLPLGTYVLFTELISLHAKKQVFKTAFHITDTR